MGETNLPPTRLETFKRSFIPTVSRLWNNVSLRDRNAPTLAAFKANLYKSNKEPNVLYYYGQRWAAVHHARLRIGCSKLKYDLCYNLHVIDNPNCTCGADIEDADHFFMYCPNYDDLRGSMYDTLSNLDAFDINTILYGNTHLSTEANKAVFDAVHKFISDTGRFI